MPIEELEKFAVSLKPPIATVGGKQSSDVSVVHGTPYGERAPPLRGAGRAGQIRRYDNFAGLEYEQKVWRWVFIALLAVSLIELWLAGWLNRPPSPAPIFDGRGSQGDVAVSAESATLSNLQGEQK